jgi:predicted ATP-grasp superfamily ATP-dependent carboligase
MALYDLFDVPDLEAPVLVGAFEGWVSAGSAGTATALHLAADAEVVASFDADELFDYRVHRPTVDFVDGVISRVDWPSIEVRLQRFAERDVLVLHGPEPNWRWQALGSAVAELAGRLGVVEFVSLGGIPWAAPHTRPTVIVTTASRTELIDEDATPPEGLLRVPGAVVSTIERALTEQGVPAVGFWARVPHYVGGVYFPAVLALTERLGRHLGISIPVGSLVENAREQRDQLDRLVEEQPGVSDVVEQLEQVFDAQGDVASGEEIAAEIERFLQDVSGDE